MLNRLTILIALVAIMLAIASPANAERRVALVIGNSTYGNATTLRNPRNDANDMAQVLKTLGFDVELGLDLDRQAFGTTMESFARSLEGADVGLFFYAGHGLQMNDKNYLVATNARLENEFMLSSEAIDLSAIVQMMESKAAVNLVFLDACRNNPLADNLRRSLTMTKRGAALGRGLARIEPGGRDTLIAFAAAPGQEAADGAERNSPFTTALLKHLPKRGVEVSVMLKEVAADVRRDTRNAQRPQQLSDMTRVFYFAAPDPAAGFKSAAVAPEPAAKVAEAPSLSDDRAADVAFWSAVQSANDCDSVRAYLQHFPSGIFVTLAKLAEGRLCRPGRQVTIVDSPAPSLQPSQPSLPNPMLTNPDPPLTAADAQPSRPAVVATLPDAPSVSIPDPVMAEAGIAATELVRNTQVELLRVGCAVGQPDGKWGLSSRTALRSFKKHTQSTLDADDPSPALLAALRDHDERVCPLQCGRGMRVSGNSCVAIQREPPRSRRKAVVERPVERRRSSRAERAEVERRPSYRAERVERGERRPVRPPPTAMAPPAQEAPHKCYLDEGYGRKRPCDAGR